MARFTALNSGLSTTSSALLINSLGWHDAQGGEHEYTASFTDEETEFVLLEGHRT